ncbi:MAG: hypothetical protein HOP28_12485 [Gemmatimonadales bacterium]|nr:hypothetical protein [Gemmatimonadales bacterium]
MPTRVLAARLLLLGFLAGCGGGADPAPAPAAVPGDTDGTPGTAAAQGAAPKAAPKIDQSMIPPPGAPLVRETYAYSGGSRDPFESVLGRGNLGPELPDLDLVGIYLLQPSSASVAVLRDRLTNKRYNVREGDRLGRMRVSDIRKQDVTFMIDDYGTTRQETLSLRKQEGNP